MAHPDLELRKGRGGALLAFLPPGISFFAQNKGVGGGGWGVGVSPSRSTTDCSSKVTKRCNRTFTNLVQILAFALHLSL